MQHGKASGLDTYVSLHGGCVRFQNGEARELPLPRVPLYIVNTGTPASTTGDAVAAVARRHGAASPVWDHFEGVANQMQKALQRDDLKAFQKAMRENHRLLDGIGVVPGRVSDFVGRSGSGRRGGEDLRRGGRGGGRRRDGAGGVARDAGRAVREIRL
jgi:mevalonate kinase